MLRIAGVCRRSRAVCRSLPALSRPLLQPGRASFTQRSMALMPLSFPEYRDIEEKWQTRWNEGGMSGMPQVGGDDRPSFYSLSMFPYPSGG